jgi:hypothetical protein
LAAAAAAAAVVSGVWVMSAAAMLACGGVIQAGAVGDERLVLKMLRMCLGVV